MKTFLSDPQSTQDYHDEYLKLINYYQNTKRPAAFIKYYNINNSVSIHTEEEMDTTYDIYSHSEIRFDIYDLTPCNYVLPITNTTSPVTDLAGQMYDGVESLVIFSVKRPRIHDLITFYPPIMSDEVFRVASIRTQLNAVHSMNAVNWFELQLEYAPVGDLSHLKIEKNYVYDLSSENNVLKSDYEKYLYQLDNLKESLKLIEPFYDRNKDMYVITDTTNIYVPIELNEMICYIKDFFSQKYKDLFQELKKPYGYIDRFTNFSYPTIQSMPFLNLQNHYKFYNLKNDITENYFWNKEDPILNQMDEILLLSLNIFTEFKFND